jgi:hypothetical protein
MHQARRKMIIQKTVFEELEQVFFYHFPKYHMKNLLGDFNAEVERENIVKPTVGNESLHQESNENGIRIVNFATAKNLLVESDMLPHPNITTVPILMGRITSRFTTY